MCDDFHLFSISQNKNGNDPTRINMYYSTSTWWLCLTNANVKISSRWPSWRPRLPFTVKIICMVNQVWVSLKTQATSSQELALGPVFWSIRGVRQGHFVILIYSQALVEPRELDNRASGGGFLEFSISLHICPAGRKLCQLNSWSGRLFSEAQLTAALFSESLSAFRITLLLSPLSLNHLV